MNAAVSLREDASFALETCEGFLRLGGTGKGSLWDLYASGELPFGALVLKSIVQYCETLLNFMQSCRTGY